MEFLYFLESIRNGFLDIFFIICTSFGEELVLVSLFAVIFWCINKNLAYRIAFSYFLSGVAVQGLKIHFRIDRPWVLDPDFKPVEQVMDTATGYSFPSGHTQSSTSLYSSIAFYFKKRWLYIVSFVIIALVMLSRMYLGCHTPKDVLVGFGVTIVISAAVNAIYNNFNSRTITDILVMIFIFAISAGLFGYSYYVVNAGYTTETLAMDGFKAAGAGAGFAIGWFVEKRYIKFNPKNSRIWIQILKVVIGLIGALAFKSGLKLLLGNTILANTFRYFVVIMWVTVIYPIIIKTFMKEPMQF